MADGAVQIDLAQGVLVAVVEVDPLMETGHGEHVSLVADRKIRVNVPG